MSSIRHRAAFLGAGGYHHHLGANTWESRGAAQAPEGTARLLRYTIVLPGRAVGRGAGRGHRQPRAGGSVRQPAVARLRRERVGQRPRVHDDERLRRARQRDIELAQTLLVRRDQRRLDDDDVVELEALRLARREHRDAVPEVARRCVGDELVGGDHREQAFEGAEPRRLAVRLGEQVVGVDAPDRRRRGAGAVRDRRRDVRRDRRRAAAARAP